MRDCARKASDDINAECLGCTPSGVQVLSLNSLAMRLTASGSVGIGTGIRAKPARGAGPAGVCQTSPADDQGLDSLRKRFGRGNERPAGP
eukprot:7071339-Pyramimonas_sp.AAC.1